MSELQYWVWLSERLSVRPKRKLELLEAFGDVRALYFALENDYRAALPSLAPAELRDLADKDLDGACRALRILEERNLSMLTVRDAAYPERLRQIYDPPAVLYLRGRMPRLDDHASVAVAGTRKASPYGLRTASRIGSELAACGGIVVSGLTAGVDAEAARGALLADGIVIGVLGGAIDAPFAGHLQMDVARRGAVVSEFAPGSGIGKVGFRMRNRITAGLSLAAVIVEAPERSGALLFAGDAADQNREIFAVPGNADAPGTAGTNQLLKDGARPATCGWDVLEDYVSMYPTTLRRAEPKRSSAPVKPAEEPRETGEGFYKLRQPIRQKVIDKAPAPAYSDLQRQLSGLSETQLKIVAAMDTPHQHVDDIIRRCGMPAASVLSELTVLQIQGYVLQEPGKRFSLNIKESSNHI